MHSLPSIRLLGLPKDGGRAGDGARTNKRSVSVFVRAKGKSRRCAAAEAPTVFVAAAAHLSSDEFLKGIYNVATSPSRLFTARAFPLVAATRLASHRTIRILVVYRTLPLSFRASIVAIRHGSPANFC